MPKSGLFCCYAMMSFKISVSQEGEMCYNAKLTVVNLNNVKSILIIKHMWVWRIKRFKSLFRRVTTKIWIAGKWVQCNSCHLELNFGNCITSLKMSIVVYHHQNKWIDQFCWAWNFRPHVNKSSIGSAEKFIVHHKKRKDSRIIHNT